jgi:hypothetical protein
MARGPLRKENAGGGCRQCCLPADRGRTRKLCCGKIAWGILSLSDIKSGDIQQILTRLPPSRPADLQMRKPPSSFIGSPSWIVRETRNSRLAAPRPSRKQGKRNFQGRDKEAETALEIQGRRCGDKISLGNSANSGPIAGFRKISVRTRMRGGGRSRSRTCLRSPIPC